jgi:hypothetical protein
MVGTWETVLDDDSSAQVHRADERVYVIKRHVDGGWMKRVWVSKAGTGWRISEQEHVISSRYSDELESAINEGIILSRTTKG